MINELVATAPCSVVEPTILHEWRRGPLITERILLLLSGVNVKQRGDDEEYQAFHENEKAWHEMVTFVVGIRIGHKRSEY